MPLPDDIRPSVVTPDDRVDLGARFVERRLGNFLGRQLFPKHRPSRDRRLYLWLARKLQRLEHREAVDRVGRELREGHALAAHDVLDHDGRAIPDDSPQLILSRLRAEHFQAYDADDANQSPFVFQPPHKDRYSLPSEALIIHVIAEIGDVRVGLLGEEALLVGELGEETVQALDTRQAQNPDRKIEGILRRRMLHRGPEIAADLAALPDDAGVRSARAVVNRLAIPSTSARPRLEAVDDPLVFLAAGLAFRLIPLGLAIVVADGRTEHLSERIKRGIADIIRERLPVLIRHIVDVEEVSTSDVEVLDAVVEEAEAFETEAEVVEEPKKEEKKEEPEEAQHDVPDPGESGVDDIMSKLGELDDPENKPKKKEKKSDDDEDASGMDDILGKLDEL